MKYLFVVLAILSIVAADPVYELDEEFYAKYGDHNQKTFCEYEYVPEQSEVGEEISPYDEIYIRIFKEESVLEIWHKTNGQFRFYKEYPICYYSGDLGPKLKRGDRQAPEGVYSITKKRLNPYSKYRLSMNIGYPNRYDRLHGRTGSYIMIHGGCSSIGCFAMGDDQIDEIYSIVENSLKYHYKVDVHIFPFRLTEENLLMHRDSKWIGFWKRLKKYYKKVS